MSTLEPSMSGEHGFTIVARVGRFLILWLRKIPVGFFGLVKMMASNTAEPIFGLD
jgi:predicted regulator of Ras-like GTPase activity (Roadblock/LC7/MglB family)